MKMIFMIMGACHGEVNRLILEYEKYDEDIFMSIYSILYSGHKITMSSVVAVLSEVKNLNALAEAMDMPDELSRDIFTDSAQREETIGRVSEFWLQGNPSWQELKGILQKCDEHKALELNHTMELYNHEGILGEAHILECRDT